MENINKKLKKLIYIIPFVIAFITCTLFYTYNKQYTQPPAISENPDTNTSPKSEEASRNDTSPTPSPEQELVPNESENSTSQNETISPDNNTTVYIAKTGKVYHIDIQCPYIKGKDNLRKSTLAEAEEMELKLCKYCKSHKED